MKKRISIILLSIITVIVIIYLLEIFSVFEKTIPVDSFIYSYFFKIYATLQHNSIFIIPLSFGLFIIAWNVPKYRLFLFNMGFFFLVLGAACIYFINQMKQPIKTIHSPLHVYYSKTLGYEPTKNFIDHSIEYKDDTVIFDVKYSIDNDGLRKTPPMSFSDSANSIVFFGCSMTFGEGLNDNEVLPNVVQSILKNKFKIYNFAYTGYGTHQMLSAIENNRVDSIVKADPKFFIYVAIPDHIVRLMGYRNWDQSGPHYVLNPNTNEPERIGNFSDQFWRKIINIELLNRFRKLNIDTLDTKLFGAMVRKAKSSLHRKYPKSEFHVLLWHWNNPLGIKMEKELKKNNIATHLVTNIIPDFVEDGRNYCIHWPYETHPNYRFNQRVAKYIVNNIINKNNKEEIVDHFTNLNNWSVQSKHWACEMLKSQISITNSGLTLTLDANRHKGKEFKSGEIRSLDFFQFGNITLHLKVNNQPGTVATVYLTNKWGSQERKVEMQFLGNKRDTVLFSVNDNQKDNKQIAYIYPFRLTFNPAIEFHDYTFSWNKDSISWFIDKKLVYTENRIKIDDGLFVNINQWAVSSKNNNDLRKWMGNVDTLQLPSNIYVDYMHYKPL